MQEWFTMGRSDSTILLFSFFFFLTVAVGSSSSALFNEEVIGLIAFKADLQDSSLSLFTWNEEDNSPCNWTGIECRPSDGRVVKIVLDRLSLSGRIGKGLAQLQYLQTLSLAHNNITMGIDSALSQSTELISLNLSYNGLSGPLPSVLANLSSLRYLDLSGNSFSGPISSELFANCKTLRYVSLARNSLIGSLPFSISFCSELIFLNVSSNQLMGELPKEVGTLPKLEVLDVSHNSLHGFIPMCSWPQRSLVTLHMDNNKLSGSIPDQLGSCTGLQKLDLSFNSLSKEIPSSLQSLKLLSTLILKRNFLTGNIPTWLNNLPRLEVVNIANNFLSGSIPSSRQFNSLQVFDFSNNNLSGFIPKEIFGSELRVLQLSKNRLSGMLPPQSFQHCARMQILDLSQNLIGGAIPPGLTNCLSIEYFNISSNSFSGAIPQELGQIKAIRVLDISDNNISGSIPVSLVENSKKLQILVLSHNQITGKMPAELGNCSSLSIMSLSHNALSGSIPPELGNLGALQLLDLSFNHFSGAIPEKLGFLQNLRMINLSYNELSGPIPNGGIFNQLNAKAFSGNEELCGADVNITCPSVLPKPIVLNPDAQIGVPSGLSPLVKSRRKKLVLSPSAFVAIGAACLITIGIFVVIFLNLHARGVAGSSRMRSNNSLSADSFSQSPTTDLSAGKLVMFAKSPSDPSPEDWVTSAHALLNKDSELGHGGFGTVYKAVLADGRTVAIKKLMLSRLVKSQEDFEKEVQVLGRMKHKNLVGMQGYYWTSQLQLLIYDYIAHGNLYSRLHEKLQKESSPIGWSNRFKIALGTARGLAHLHHACRPQIIHYNLKSSNILLDANFVPKIADYGLAKLLPMLDRYIMSSKFQSALGYMAPEFACQSLKINEKCDVYGFGVILLELVTGRRPVEYMEDDVVILCDYVRSLLEEGRAMSCVDSGIHDYVEDEVLPLIKLGLLCTSQVPSNRPSMSEVVQILELIKTPASSSRD